MDLKSEDSDKGEHIDVSELCPSSAFTKVDQGFCGDAHLEKQMILKQRFGLVTKVNNSLDC